MSRYVLVIGEVMTDVVVRVEGDASATKVAELLAARAGGELPARVTTRPSGAGANVAAWLGHLGVRTVFVTAVGTDLFGRDAVAVLRGQGVQVRHVLAWGLPTGTCVVLVDATGERTLLPDQGANVSLAPDDLPPEEFSAGGHLHLSGYTLLTPGSRPAGVVALRRARDTGMTTSVDAASASLLRELGGAQFLRLVDDVGTLLVTQDQAEALTGTTDVGGVLDALLPHVHEVVLKLGSSGACFASRSQPEPLLVPSASTGAVVDSSGADEAFAAAWLAFRSRDSGPVWALKAACLAAADAVASPSTRP